MASLLIGYGLSGEAADKETGVVNDVVAFCASTSKQANSVLMQTNCKKGESLFHIKLNKGGMMF